MADLTDALAELGVEPGDDFTIAKAVKGEAGGLGPFNRNSKTSREAALANYPREGSQRHRILIALWQRDDHGGTRDELVHELHLPDSSVDPRVCDLMTGGFVEVSSRTRPTVTGNEAEVLVLTPYGKDEVQGRSTLFE